MMPRRKPDPDLFDGLPPTPQPRLVKAEPPELYDAVIRLRFQGFQVYRAGRDKHLIRARTGTRGRKVGEKASILRHLVEGGDLSRFGLFNAVTRTAEDLPDYDRATDFERIGGQIIELPANDWKRIAEAA